MPELSIKDQIRKIVELQKIDGEIFNLKVQLEEKPAELELLKKEFDEKKGGLFALEEKLKAVLLKRKENETELKGKEDEITKSNSQLSQIKTNKEYTAKIAEMEHIKADKSVIEEKILLSYDESDAVEKDVSAAREVLGADEKAYLVKKKEAEDDVKLIQDRIKVLGSQRTQALTDIDPAFLGRYDQVLKHKQGVGIVPVHGGNTCGGCYMNITPQQINAIKMYDHLVECEMCLRILYLEDDL